MYETDMADPVIFAARVAFPVGWAAARHSHPHSELILVTAGSMTAVVGEAEVAAEAGDILLYPPGVPHRECNAGRRELAMVVVHAGLDPQPVPRLVDRGGRLGQLVRWLAEDQAAGAPSAVRAAWVAAINAQARQCAAGGSGLADAVRSAMRAQLARPHSLEELARAVGLGSRQLQRRYRAETGTSPMADLRRLRCEAAAGLLAATDWPLERIAREVGFCDAFHLSKLFRRRFGMPPGRMRRRVPAGSLSPGGRRSTGSG